MAEVVSAVKVGDRVRVTCGGNVNFGLVKFVYPSGVVVKVDVDGDPWFFRLSAWTVEVIAPLILDTYGTVVLDQDNDAWQRGDDGWYISDHDGSSWSFDKLQELAGPLTVLWTPEAES